MSNLYKTPRLYTNQPLEKQVTLEVTPEQLHYLRNVMRMECGDELRLFNGQDGEWLYEIKTLSKKEGILAPTKQLKPQPKAPEGCHLLFAPIKKQRLDILIEKAVELGATDLHPVLTAHTENRNLKIDRMQAQIIEAAEQCERLDIPTLHTPESLNSKIQKWDHTPEIMAALERTDAPHIQETISQSTPLAFLIGPEGGFSSEELEKLQNNEAIKPVSLGPRILRAETACLLCLSLTKN